MSLLDDDIERISDINLYKNIMQKRMIVSRVIHPIGQGAFYTERIRTNGKTFNILYDCGGTTSYKVNWLSSFGIGIVGRGELHRISPDFIGLQKANKAGLATPQTTVCFA